MMTKKPLVIISGATAVGKTELSINLAKEINGEIISADSMQVYKGFDIGTAKITKEEMSGVPHFLIDELEPDDEFNVYEFKRRADNYIEQILDRGHIPIIVGGTGFYIHSVLYNIEFTEEETDKEYREELEKLALIHGPEYLHDKLMEVDPESAADIHPNNVRKVIRALEYYKETGQKISIHNALEAAKESPFNFAYFVLNRDRKTVYERINKRVEQMAENGLIEEVRGLLDSGISSNSLAMQGLGYKEIVRYLDKEISLEEALEILKQGTRKFSKRQVTWFKREKEVTWMNYEDFDSNEEMLKKIIKILKEKNIV